MTASIKYWRLPEEEADLVEYLRSIEPTMALPLRVAASPEQLIWKPIDEALGDPERSFLITPSRFVSQMKVHRTDNPTGYIADVTATPALHYSRGYLVTPRQLSWT